MVRCAVTRCRLFYLLLALLFCVPVLAGEPQWIEITSPNFRVYTDAGEKRGREVALHFEQMRFVFGKLFLKAKVQTGVPVRVMAFRNTKGFRSVTPLWKGKAKDIAGFYLQGDAVAFIALDLSSQQGWNTVFHEYAHLLLNSNMTNTPVWFDEGFAEFYSTAKIEKSEWVIGSLPEYATQQLANDKFIPLADLFGAGHDSTFYNERDHASMFYAESWLAVEYFWFVDPERRKQLLRYFTLLEQKVAVAEALKQAFGKDPAQLDKDLVRYFREGKARVSTFKSPPALENLEMKAAQLDELDARAAIAELRLNIQDYATSARIELESILQQKPDQPAALRSLGYAAIREGDFKKARTYLERSVALGSEDARVYLYWAMAVENEGGRHDSDMQEKMRTALEKCIALDPQLADAYSLLGFVQAQTDFDAAVTSMKTAIALSPRKMENYLNMATLYLGHGKIEEASELLQQVVQSSNVSLAAQAQSLLADIAQMNAARASFAAGRDQNSHYGNANETFEAQDYELKSFSGTLVKIDCQKTKIIITVNTGKEKLVLSGDIDHVSIGGKPLYCDLKGVKVHGHYNGKDSVLVALTVE